ncbi:hypothetical protein GCM10010401_14050 [Rarobacter faecitabidus]|uniref:Transcription factor WhiB n=1 Tax=Rarobacter faecitabidus TaxID=13243 RepID=A0A542ZE61_RARFA|nr:WhiB family transcriptional regulator [Rarobacter faecitabidus]TQL58550.1 transcription factor WhiB [Rarobacter faecitabidus]
MKRGYQERTTALEITPEFLAKAACTGREDDLFYHVDDEPRGERRIRDRRAATICATCPVFEQCAQIGTTERAGVWAGICRECPPETHAVDGNEDDLHAEALADAQRLTGRLSRMRAAIRHLPQAEGASIEQIVHLAELEEVGA